MTPAELDKLERLLAQATDERMCDEVVAALREAAR